MPTEKDSTGDGDKKFRPVEIQEFHSWYITPKEAKSIQKKLTSYIILKSNFSSLEEINIIAGADVSYSSDETYAYASVVILKLPELKLIEKLTIPQKINWYFPYIPGLLSFREAPFLLNVFKKIKNTPQLILFDGQGIAHPQRLGLATHLGIILNKPTIGCAKSLLYGKYEEPVNLKGAFTNLLEKNGELIGAVLRTRKKVKPIFVSCGYKIDLNLAIDVVLKCCPKYKIPEPLRLAHQETMKVKSLK